MNINDSRAKDLYKINDSKSDLRETNINHLYREDFCQIESNEDYWVRKIKELEKEYPDEIIIKKEGKDYICAIFPYRAMKLFNLRKRREMSEEEKEMRGKILTESREKRKKREE